MDAFPMFPLGTVLLPGMLLPLQVFEPRYRRLVADVLGTLDDSSGETGPVEPERTQHPAAEFGVALIARGSEVGGGDIRTDVGCVARILEAQQTDDGRWGILAVGTRRLRILRWVPDDPYPRAEVVDWPDEQPADDIGVTERLANIETTVRRLGALVSELGLDGVPVDLAFADDPVSCAYQLAVMSPLGPMDRQRILAAVDLGERLDHLETNLAEQEELIRGRLAFGDDGGFA